MGDTLAVPLVISDETVRFVVIDKLGWIKRQRTQFAQQPHQSQRKMVNGESHYVFGKRYRLRVHELLHLLERRHSDRFTALMDGFLPN